MVQTTARFSPVVCIVVVDGVTVYLLVILFWEGEHNASYTVSSSPDGLKFTKVRHSHPVQYARANYSKVK